MENYRSLYHSYILNVRKLILEVRYYQNHRAKWEVDKSQELLVLAQANLRAAGSMLDCIKWKESHA